MRVSDLLRSAFNLFGLFRQPEYDVIVIGGGAAGCPLAQTLVEGGQRVLLLERGGEPEEASRSIYTFGESIRGSCSDPIIAETGHVMVSGNCLGGATNINGGAWVEETAEWVLETILATAETSFVDASAIDAAFAWVRQHMSPEPSSEPAGTYLETFSQDLADAIAQRTDFEYVADGVLQGQPEIAPSGVFRTHSLFDANGDRRSADLILDRDAPNLHILTGAKVQQLTYQGDWLGTPFTMDEKATEPATARCVRLDTWELHCVKPGGRIYITAGTLHTPVILMNSGVGEGGNKVDNPAVGQNLSDKFSAKLTANLKKGMDFGGGASFGNIAATQQLNDRTVIYEQSSSDLDDALWNLSSYERTIFPLPLRGSLAADVVYMVGDLCDKDVVNDASFMGIRNPLCAVNFQLDENNCDRNIFGLSVFTSPPRPVGSVGRTIMGRPKVDINFFETDADYEALGKIQRTSLEILESMDLAEPPCDRDADPSCTTCPNLINSNAGIVNIASSILSPFIAMRVPEYPDSRFTAAAVESIMKTQTADVAAGKMLSDTVNSGQHFVGTAAMGSVVDNTFKVKGLKGAYVADASVLPKTSRGNVMATVMMMARLAGLSALEEIASN